VPSCPGRSQRSRWVRSTGCRTRASVGEADIVERNLVQTGRNLAPHAALFCAIVDAAGSDDELRRLWRDVVVQARIDATAAAIRRDQAAGAIRAQLDAADTARALTLMNSELALELLGRQGAMPRISHASQLRSGSASSSAWLIEETAARRSHRTYRTGPRTLVNARVLRHSVSQGGCTTLPSGTGRPDGVIDDHRVRTVIGGR